MPFTRALTKSLKFGRHVHMSPKKNLTLRPSYESAQLDIYIFIYNTITNLIVSIVNILHNAPLYSTI